MSPKDGYAHLWANTMKLSVWRYTVLDTTVGTDKKKEVKMLTLLLVIGIILFILWILGFSIGFLAGPILWIILVVAVILVIIWLARLLMNRR